jgi:hypothetical protein
LFRCLGEAWLAFPPVLRRAHVPEALARTEPGAFMTDIFREVEEDLRRERLNKLWQRYGAWIVGLAALIVLGVAGWRIYEHWQATRAAASGDQFTQAIGLASEGKHAEATDRLAVLARSGSGAYPLLARFRAAAERADSDTPAAAAAFDTIAADSGAPGTLRDLARIRAANLLVGSAPREEVARRVESLAVAGNPWRHSARELMALAAWKAGDLQAAERWFAEASGDPEVPQGIRGRADLFLTLIAGSTSATASVPEASQEKATD